MITMITGGQRSGKSLFAEGLARRRSESPIYLATAQVLDDEFRCRVDAHKRRRGPEWSVIEEPLHVGTSDIPQGATVLLDCITLLATNWFFHEGEDHMKALESMKTQLYSLFDKDADFIVVTNEVGLGGVSPNALQRHFADLQGAVNQFVAARADEVYLVISGIPVTIKS